MNKILIIFLFCFTSAETQSLAQINNNFFTTESNRLGQWNAFTAQTRNASIFESVSMSGIGNTEILGSLPRSYFSNPTDVRGLSSPSYTSYVVLPNDKNPFIEFVDRKITSDNSTITLQSTTFSAVYSSTLPVSITNGGSIVQRGLYSNSTYGNGDIPWAQITAPTTSTGVYSELATFANNANDNVIGAYKINLPNGNSLQLATTDAQSGVVGFLKPFNTSLVLASESITVPGKFYVDGTISSKSGIYVAGSNNIATLSLMSTGLTTIDALNKDFWGIKYNGVLGKSESSSLVMETNRTGGMMFSAYSLSNYEPSIGFSLNTFRMLEIKTAGLVVGGGESTPTSIFTVNSDNKMIVLPRLSDEAILSLPPNEGGIVYSKDHQSIVFADGKKWQVIKSKKLVGSKKSNYL